MEWLDSAPLALLSPVVVFVGAGSSSSSSRSVALPPNTASRSRIAIECCILVICFAWSSIGSSGKHSVSPSSDSCESTDSSW